MNAISWWRRTTMLLVLWLGAGATAFASEYHGVVTYAGLPVPGAVVTAVQGAKKIYAVTNQMGVYSFADLGDGTWTIEVEMLCFQPAKQEVQVAPGVAAGAFELKLLTLEQIRVAVKPVPGIITSVPQAKSLPAKAGDAKTPEMAQAQDENAQKAADGLLINGSVNNAATSKFSMAQAFGNNRNGGKGLYNGSIGIILDNSSLDAKPYSLSGLDTGRPSYNNLQGVFTFGGPIKIPHVLLHGPNFFVAYQRTRDTDAAAQAGLVPDAGVRAGNFSQLVDAAGKPVVLYDSAGKPYPGNIVPVSPVAQALLNLYPLPNVAGNTRYNYQISTVNSTHQDGLQTRLNKQIGRKNNVFGDFAFQSSRSSAPNLFNFVDTQRGLGLNAGVNWSYQRTQHLGFTLGYRFSRQSTRAIPYWENRANVSGAAGISGVVTDSTKPTTGNDQDPTNWGPPTLNFSGGVSGLSDGNASFNRNRTDALSLSVRWTHRAHNVTLGGDFRRQEFNYLRQQNPRGTFTFTGAATQAMVNGVAVGGSDVADFLIGVPDTSALGTGNADKYLRQSVYDAFANDDWRITPAFTLNAGVRWEYGAPITELKGRLANLDVAPGFTDVRAVLAGSPVGPLTGQHYPDSLLRADRADVEPRVSFSWRPIPGSSLVVRGGYGMYVDTSVYQTTALALAEQAPFATSLSVQNSAACPLTLAYFSRCSTVTADTFGVDPNFRVGYAQTWQLSAQKDLPGSLQMTATYLGIKGTRGNQEFLPNTYPVNGVNPCPSCPVGFVYLASNGNSTRESGQLQLRRRLHNGLTAQVQYTFAKAVDDDSALGGQGPVAPGVSPAAAGSSAIAQDWRNLKGERARSTFDQRHQVTGSVQYTTGMGIGGHSLLSGWRGAAYKEWTVQAQVTAGTGLPETPVYPYAVPGTGFYGSLRPSLTGASVTAAPAGRHLNPAAYVAPAAGVFGNAGRNSITGPNQFSLVSSAGRTFRLTSRYNLDIRVDATNVLNHVTYSSWNTTLDSAQFGVPQSANAMRSLLTTARLRF